MRTDPGEMTVEVNGLKLRMYFFPFTLDKGAEYTISINRPEHLGGVRFPNVRTLRNVAKKHLGSSYQEFSRRETFFVFAIEAGTSKESRAAFLAAVAARTVLPQAG